MYEGWHIVYTRHARRRMDERLIEAASMEAALVEPDAVRANARHGGRIVSKYLPDWGPRLDTMYSRAARGRGRSCEDPAMVRDELRTLRITLEATETGVLGYVYVREAVSGAARRQAELAGGAVIADYSGEGDLLGLEFLHAEAADAELLQRLARDLRVPELAGLDLSAMCRTPA